MGSIVCNIEGSAPFRHFEVSHDEIMDGSDPLRSGLILAAGDQSRVQAYYAPVLGPAPRWCSFLDSITEELEERGMADEGVKERNTESVYDDYKFLTKEEVEMLGINNLVGTPLLKGYMHGYFIETSLYSKIRSVANPFEYDEYRKRKVREKVEEKRASRITPREKDKIGKGVNKELADRLIDKKKKGKNAGKTAEKLLGDDRFGGLFENPDFAIDENAHDFKLRNPSGVAARGQMDEDMDSESESDGEGAGEGGGAPAGFDAVRDNWGGSDDDEDEDEDDDDDAMGWGSDSDDSAFNEDGYRNAKVRGEMYEGGEGKKKKDKKKREKEKKKKEKARRKMKQMFESSTYGSDLAMKSKEERERKAEEGEMKVGERVQRMKEEEKERGYKRVKTKGGIVREFEMKIGKKKHDRKTEGRSRLEGDGGGRGKRRKAKF